MNQASSANGPFVIYADTDDMPGKVELVFVSFQRRVFDKDEFYLEPQEFDMLDPAHPYAGYLRGVLEVEA